MPVDRIIDPPNTFGSRVAIFACPFTSELPAALFAVEAWGDFVCEYAGVEKTHEASGRCPLFRPARR